MNPSPRNWFPVIIAGLTVMLAIVFYTTNRSVDLQHWVSDVGSRGSEDSTLATVEPAPTEEEYKTAVRTILSTYNTDGNAQAAYDAFIQLHVPSIMQSFHIDLIIAFGKLAAKTQTDGAARLNALEAQNSWLSL